MKLTPEERAARRAAFRGMELRERAEYVLEYYRVHILLGLAVLALLIAGVRGRWPGRRSCSMWAAATWLPETH